ncbi:hypothetical protein CONPUDRAFT_158391 [Coniophora puteana RWD-64-598 SS2]|uniref:F-box domain-containing protein n=1 Tax=Coniophora puteana (strain RWD-64-598) TaxID=741705 RepID=A0A5M3MBD3_CONPW|nr:uncharacterized protein CONPUDRAFT_158391 [Coniophora puteana RWD-64-598 SS2]EIW76367.1 hypothetical protein CONPUDRAFT_158391 [Coniophora puteana RWD-64-598 SS2]
MQHASQHFDRVTILSISVVYRSSIVEIGRRFLNRAVLPNLTRLGLVSQETDDTSAFVDDDDDHMSRYEKCTAHPEFPELRELQIDARSFFDLYLCDTEYPCNQFKLRLTKYGAAADTHSKYESANMLDLIDALSELSRAVNTFDLEIEDVATPPDDLGWGHKASYPRIENIASVKLVNIQGPFVSTLFDCMSEAPESTIIERCEVKEHTVMKGEELRLVGISGPSLLYLVGFWEGLSLSVKDCSGFNDDFLDALSKHSRGVTCSNMESLEVEGCTAFSAEMLRDTCDIRDNIEQLTVSDGPELNEVQRMWFEDNFDRFYWSEMK